MNDSQALDHRANRLLAALPTDTLAAMAGDLRQVAIAQGPVLYEPGNAIDTIYFPQTGLISLLIVTADGNTIETSIVGREGAVGMQGGNGARRSFTRATADGRRAICGRRKRCRPLLQPSTGRGQGSRMVPAPGSRLPARALLPAR